MNSNAFASVAQLGPQLDQYDSKTAPGDSLISLEQVSAALQNAEQLGLTAEQVAALQGLSSDAYAQGLLDAADGRTDQNFSYRNAANFNAVIAAALETKKVLEQHLPQIDTNADGKVQAEELSPTLQGNTSSDHSVLQTLVASLNPAGMGKDYPLYYLMDAADGAQDSAVDVADLQNLSAFANAMVEPSSAPITPPALESAEPGGQGWGGQTSQGETGGEQGQLPPNPDIADTPPPVAAASHYLPQIEGSDRDNPGTTVAQVLGTAVSDTDPGTQIGLAVTATSGMGGSWQYSVDGGNTWSEIGSVTDQQALLLSPTDQVRFTPDGTGGGEATLTYRAWDQSAGQVGQKLDTSSSGGSTAFSVAKDTVGVQIREAVEVPAPDANADNPTQAPVEAPTDDLRLLSLGLARGVVLPYRNYFDGLAREIQGDQHIKGVITLDVLKEAAKQEKLPKEALDRLNAFLANPDAYAEMRDRFVGDVNDDGENRAYGLYFDAMQRWTEILGSSSNPGQVDAVDAAGGVAGDPLVNFFDKSRGDALTDADTPEMRGQRIEDVATIILRHRNLFNPEGDDGHYDKGWTIAVSDVKEVLEKYSDKLSSEEVKALSKFSQSDFSYLMSLEHEHVEGLREDEMPRALGNGRLSIDWLEKWLFVNNADPRSDRAGAEDYTRVAGEPMSNQPDRTYAGLDIYDWW